MSRPEPLALYELVTEVVERHDPFGLVSDDPDLGDAYDPEVTAIVDRLPEVGTRDELLATVHGVFAEWFGADEAGPPDRYATIADDLWTVLAEHARGGG